MGGSGKESLFMFHLSDCPKGESERGQPVERIQVGGLERDSSVTHSVGRYSLAIGKTVAHRGVGRSIPIPFTILLRRNTNGGVESGGSYRLGLFSVN